jgi:hypothetical protein
VAIFFFSSDEGGGLLTKDLEGETSPATTSSKGILVQPAIKALKVLANFVGSFHFSPGSRIHNNATLVWTQ